MPATIRSHETVPTWWAPFERRRFDLQHRYRTVIATRRKVSRAATGALAAVGLVVLALNTLVGGEFSWWAGLATVAVVVLVRWAMMRPASPPHAHDLPGLPEPPVCPVPDPPDRGPWVIAVRWLGAATAVLVAVAAPTVLLWSAVALTAVAAAPVLVDLVRLRRARRAVREAVDRFGARFVLAYGGYGGGPIHVGMWESHLLASGDRGVIVNLRGQYCAELRAGIAPTMPWIQTGSDVLGDMLVISGPAITTYFYVHNAPGHLKMLAMTGVRHVWLGHGDSDKAGSHHQRHRRYDVLVASGSAAVDRYARHGVEIPAERFMLLGRPQSGDVLPATGPITSVDRPTVLYAPTWPGNGNVPSFSSISVAPAIVQALIAADTNVIFRPHPVFLRSEYWAPKLEQIAAILADDTADPSTLGQHVWGDLSTVEWSVAECMNRADALVSDVSSVVSDWLASGKPYLMINVHHTPDEFVAEVPVAAGGYVVNIDLVGLADGLDEMLHRDPMVEQRRKLKVSVLGEYEGTESAAAFAAFVHEMAHTPMARD